MVIYNLWYYFYMETDDTDRYSKKFAAIATAIIKEKDRTKVPKEIVGLVSYYNNLKATEEGIARSIVPWILKQPIYTEYLDHLTGIGPILSANLVAMLTPIESFPKPSMLVSYAGLAGSHYEQECANGHKFMTVSPKPRCPVNLNETDRTEIVVCGADIVESVFVNAPMKRKRGYHIFQQGRLKTTMYKIATSIEKQSPDRSYYRKLYDMKKALYASRPDIQGKKGWKGHARMMALRYIEKRFIVNLHVVWMTALGHEVTPYEATLPNHTLDPIVTDDGVPIPEKGSMKPVPEEENWTIKQLTDSYYDIQKMRIKCFNNVVAWIKTNPERVSAFISSDDDKGEE